MYLKFVRKVGLQCSHHRKKEKEGARKEGREGGKKERERKKGREKENVTVIITLTVVIISQRITYVTHMKALSCTKQLPFVTYTSRKLKKQWLSSQRHRICP